jgi:cytochrome P450
MIQKCQLPAAPVPFRSERWRTLRVAWQPTFTSSSLHGYVPVMGECAGQLVERLAALAKAEPGGEVDIWRQLGDLTLNVVGGTAYG